MNTIKQKFISILVVIAMIMSLLSTMAVFAAPESTLKVSSSTIKAGEPVTVTYTIPNSVTASGIGLRINFDKTRLEATSITWEAISGWDAMGSDITDINNNGFFACTWSTEDAEDTATATNLKLVTAAFQLKDGAPVGNAEFTVDDVQTEISNVNGDSVFAASGANKESASVNVVSKASNEQAALNITSADNAIYGQSLTLTTAGGSGTGAVTYSVTNGSGEATLAGNVLTPTKAGTVTVTATKAGDDTYNSISSAPALVTINKATITITAKNKSAYIGDTAPVLGASDYTVTGLASSETLKTLPTIEYLTAPDMTQTGTATIKVSAAEAPDGGNYNDIVYKNGTLTISEKSSGGNGGGGEVTGYTVKFETNGGSKVESADAAKNNAVKEPIAPTKEGFTFDGWYTDEKLTAKYDFSSKVTKDFTLYAKWNENEKPVTSAEWENPFTDVKKSDWFYDVVKEAYTGGLIKGTSETTFSPNSSITRAMFVTILYRSEGEPALGSGASFTDVESGSYYANAVVWAKENSIVNGVTENTFAPNNNITREQMAAILYRYAKFKGLDVSVGENTNILSYNDKDLISEYAIPAIGWAVGAGVISGKPGGILDPIGNATRAEATAMLVRMLGTIK